MDHVSTDGQTTKDLTDLYELNRFRSGEQKSYLNHYYIEFRFLNQFLGYAISWTQNHLNKMKNQVLRGKTMIQSQDFITFFLAFSYVIQAISESLLWVEKLS